MNTPRQTIDPRPLATCRAPRRVRRGGLSLVELLIALAIISALLVATGVALDVSFKAYAIATQSASTQSSSRLLTNRLLTNIRNAASHGPVEFTAQDEADGAVLVNDTVIQTPFVEFTDRNGDAIRLQYFDSTTAQSANDLIPGPNQLWMRRTRFSGGPDDFEPVLKGVTACTFTMLRGLDENGVYELRRVSFDFTVTAGDDSTLQIEAGNVPPVRVIASTKPRRI